MNHGGRGRVVVMGRGVVHPLPVVGSLLRPGGGRRLGPGRMGGGRLHDGVRRDGPGGHCVMQREVGRTFLNLCIVGISGGLVGT